jgi:hypothetical protein
VSRLIRSAAVAATAALLATGPAWAAEGTDREDPIPAAVGPGNVRGFYVNPDVPPGYDSQRWLALVQRDLRRWGDPFLGTTTASPAAHSDGQNTIGFSFLAEGQLGLTTMTDNGLPRSLSRVEPCSTSEVSGTADTVGTTVRRVRVRLRRDVIRDGRVRRRTLRRSVERRSKTLRRDGLTASQCVTGPDAAVTRLATREVDIELARDTGDTPWEFGPVHPAESEVDLEETLLHELGHAHGLAHQIPECDISTPMRASLPPGSWWRAQDDASWIDCEANTMTPPDTPPDPGPPGGTPLAGITVHANPTLAGGLDPNRFLAVVGAVVARLGGTFGGTTTAEPGHPDATSVVGLAPVFADSLVETSDFALTTVLTLPRHETCSAVVRRTGIRVVKRASVRRRLSGRLVRLRRDSLVTRRRPRTDYTCTPRAATSSTLGTAREVDVRINDRYAYELGPSHPLLGTRYDLETAVLAGLLAATGTPRASDPCAPDTPVAPLMPGDWWRGPNDVSRAHCRRTDSAVPAQVRDDRPSRSRRSVVRVG